MEFKRIYDDFINCDFCGRLTRGRTWDDEPEIIRCGCCHTPLSVGSFEHYPEAKKNKGGWKACAKT